MAREQKRAGEWAWCRAGEAGLSAGALVGLVEVLFLTVRHGRAYAGALLYGVVAYGVIGGLLGLLAGRLWAWVAAGRPSWPAPEALAGGVVGGLAGTLAGRLHLFNALERWWPGWSGYAGWVEAGVWLLGGVAAAGLVLLWRRRSLPRGRGLVLLGLLLLLVWPARLWSRAVPEVSLPARTRPAGPNLLLIVADTLRADAFPCTGGDEAIPHLRALAAEGVCYTQAVASSSWTKPSFGTILTSLYPSSHTALGPVHPLPEAALTLAEVLQEAGYTTAAIVNNPYLAPQQGFDQGFDTYIYLAADHYAAADAAGAHLAIYRPLAALHRWALGDRLEVRFFYHDAAEVSDRALAWLEAHREERFFLLLHYMDPHGPYFEHPYNGRGYRTWEKEPLDPALAPAVRRVYDGEVAYLDAQVGRLLDRLRQTGLAKETLILFTADHGEEFQEHGGWDHGVTLYEEVLRVPLAIRYPGAAGGGQVVTDLVRTLDLAPTVLDAVGVPVPSVMQGVAWGRGERPAWAFAETLGAGEENPVWAVRGAGVKWLWAEPGNARGLPARALYDLAADPGERENLAEARPEQMRLGEQVWQEVWAGVQAVRVAPDAATPAALEMLERLGY